MGYFAQNSNGEYADIIELDIYNPDELDLTLEGWTGSSEGVIAVLNGDTLRLSLAPGATFSGSAITFTIKTSDGQEWTPVYNVYIHPHSSSVGALWDDNPAMTGVFTQSTIGGGYEPAVRTLEILNPAGHSLSLEGWTGSAEGIGAFLSDNNIILSVDKDSTFEGSAVVFSLLVDGSTAIDLTYPIEINRYKPTLPVEASWDGNAGMTAQFTDIKDGAAYNKVTLPFANNTGQTLTLDDYTGNGAGVIASLSGSNITVTLTDPVNYTGDSITFTLSDEEGKAYDLVCHINTAANSAANPYLVADDYGLRLMSANVDKHFRLAKDVVMSNSTWVPAGTASVPFTDKAEPERRHQGYTISGFMYFM